ncbi:MAG: DUF2288 domain-containing protein [Gammaproteobacteria bacterium]|nr:DUF2288 domain-containing protein [Gammaproteobacteria bacterium]
MKEKEDLLKHELNRQTGKITWPELEKHFARGVVIKVSHDLDLIEVALSISRDNQQHIHSFLKKHHLEHASIDDAKSWVESQPDFWAIVTAPWILIQEIKN